ncbi:MAG: diguanylate cyclase domain-containing protein [Gammaproteobacteria bacterium]
MPVNISSESTADGSPDEAPAHERIVGPSADAIYSAEISVLFNNAKSAVWANFLAAMVFAAIAVGQATTPAIVGWLVAVAVVVTGRYMLVAGWLGRPTFPEPARTAARQFMLSSILTGGVFAVAFLGLAPHLPDHERALASITIGGMCAAVAVSMNTHRPSFYGYALTILLPAVVYDAWLALREQSFVFVIETFILAAWMVIICAIHAGGNRTTRTLLVLQVEKEQLAEELERANESLQRDRDDFRVASLTDGLTGIPNRRSFDETLAAEWRRSTRHATRLGCLLLDIDFFKQFNDRYGHDVGDQCLSRVAGALRQVAQRSGDYVSRYGGEEFVLLLPNTDAAGVRHVGEAVREAVEALGIPHADSPSSVVTVSVGGGAMASPDSDSPEELIRRADEALYAAKRAGRNRVELGAQPEV